EGVWECQGLESRGQRRNANARKPVDSPVYHAGAAVTRSWACGRWCGRPATGAGRNATKPAGEVCSLPAGFVPSLMLSGLAPVLRHMLLAVQRLYLSEPATFTILLYRPKIRNVGAHWPTNSDSCLRPIT